MNQLARLIENINQYHHEMGVYLKIKISCRFFDEYALEIVKLSKDNLRIQVVNNLSADSGFILTSPNEIQING